MTDEEKELAAIGALALFGDALKDAETQMTKAIMEIGEQLFKKVPIAMGIGMMSQMLVRQAVVISSFPAIKAKRLATEKLIEGSIAQVFREVTFVDDPVSK